MIVTMSRVCCALLLLLLLGGHTDSAQFTALLFALPPSLPGNPLYHCCAAMLIMLQQCIASAFIQVCICVLCHTLCVLCNTPQGSLCTPGVGRSRMPVC